MCLTIPYQITKIKGQKVEAMSLNKKKANFLNLFAKVKVGDWVIAQNNIIIRKIKNYGTKIY